MTLEVNTAAISAMPPPATPHTTATQDDNSATLATTAATLTTMAHTLSTISATLSKMASPEDKLAALSAVAAPEDLSTATATVAAPEEKEATLPSSAVPDDNQFAEFDTHRFWAEQNFQMSARLHLRHWMWNYELGYALNPKINIPTDQPVMIADVGCNNGPWMLDVAKEYHLATMVGFDISPANFPHKSRISPNMSFHVWDALTEVPEKFVGVFDVVHLGTLFSAISDNNSAPVVENVLSMLKPGGYVQWDESDPRSVNADVPEDGETDGAAAKSMSAFFRAAHAWQNKANDDWQENLGQSFSDRGCTVLVDEQIAPRPELHRAWCDNWLSIWFGTISTIPRKPVPIPKGEDLPEMLSRDWYVETLKKAADECEQGVWLKANQQVVVVRKEA